MRSFILGTVLWILIVVDYVIIQSYYHIVPEEWIWIALVFYLLGALTGVRPGSKYGHAKFNAVFALSLPLMLLFRALTVRQWAEPAILDLDRLAMRITVLLVFDIFFVALMAVIYWGWDRWEKAHAAHAVHATAAARAASQNNSQENES